MSSIERAGYPMCSKSKTFLKKSLANDDEIKLMGVKFSTEAYYAQTLLKILFSISY